MVDRIRRLTVDTNVINANRSKRQLDAIAASSGKAQTAKAGLTGQIASTSAATAGLTGNLDRGTRSVGRFGAGSFVATGILVGFAVGLRRAGSEASMASFEFERLAAEVNALGDGTQESLAQINSLTEELTRRFGGSLANNIRLFYDSQSSGAASFAESFQEGVVASRLAIVGATDNRTALNAIIPVLNVYGRENITAAEASDQLFQSVVNGRINVEKLGPALATVIPLAKALGIQFAETNASIAVLTFAGLSPEEASTSLRAFYSSLTSITAEGEAALRAIGVDVSAERIAREGGVLNILRDLRERYNDFDINSQAALSRALFPNVRARLAFETFNNETGVALDRLEEQSTNTAKSVGIVNTRFGELTDTLAVEYNVALGDIEVSQRQIGNQINEVLVPVTQLYASVARLASDNTTALAGVITGVFVGVAVPLLFTALNGIIARVTLATAGLNIVAGILAGSVAAAYISGLGKVEVAMEDVNQASTDANTALAKFRDDGTSTSGRTALSAASNYAKLTEQLRLNSLAALEAREIELRGILGADPRAQALLDQAKLEANIAADRADRAARTRRLLAGEITGLAVLTTGLKGASSGTETFGDETENANSKVADFNNTLMRTGESIGEFIGNELEGSVRSFSQTTADSLLDSTDSWKDFGESVIEIGKQTVSNLDC